MSTATDRALRRFDIIGHPRKPHIKPIVSMSRASFDRMVKEHRFPAPFFIGRLPFWKESTVTAWLNEQGNPHH